MMSGWHSPLNLLLMKGGRDRSRKSTERRVSDVFINFQSASFQSPWRFPPRRAFIQTPGWVFNTTDLADYLIWTTLKTDQNSEWHIPGSSTGPVFLEIILQDTFSCCTIITSTNPPSFGDVQNVEMIVENGTIIQIVFMTIPLLLPEVWLL